ncbi:hypothetical protein Pfo_013867 [Paulownia fortunei]|nr:hypothetical protein Pfo_013867 [Paulownia fortunei]
MAVRVARVANKLKKKRAASTIGKAQSSSTPIFERIAISSGSPAPLMRQVLDIDNDEDESYLNMGQDKESHHVRAQDKSKSKRKEKEKESTDPKNTSKKSQISIGLASNLEKCKSLGGFVLQDVNAQETALLEGKDQMIIFSPPNLPDLGDNKYIPDWKVSMSSSILNSRVNEESYELYKACLLFGDQTVLAGVSHPRLEKYYAHSVIQTMREWITMGKHEFLLSTEYKDLIHQTRLEYARDFIKYPVFEIVVEDKIAMEGQEYFTKCRDQLLKLGRIVEDFNLDLFDPSKIANLKDYHLVVDPPLDDDEFKSLLPTNEGSLDEAIGTYEGSAGTSFFPSRLPSLEIFLSN